MLGVIVLIVAMLFDLMLWTVVLFLLFPTAAISVCPSVGGVVRVGAILHLWLFLDISLLGTESRNLQYRQTHL